MVASYCTVSIIFKWVATYVFFGLQVINQGKKFDRRKVGVKDKRGDRAAGRDAACKMAMGWGTVSDRK